MIIFDVMFGLNLITGIKRGGKYQVKKRVLKQSSRNGMNSQVRKVLANSNQNLIVMVRG